MHAYKDITQRQQHCSLIWQVPLTIETRLKITYYTIKSTFVTPELPADYISIWMELTELVVCHRM